MPESKTVHELHKVLIQCVHHNPELMNVLQIIKNNTNSTTSTNDIINKVLSTEGMTFELNSMYKGDGDIDIKYTQKTKNFVIENERNVRTALYYTKYCIDKVRLDYSSTIINKALKVSFSCSCNVLSTEIYTEVDIICKDNHVYIICTFKHNSHYSTGNWYSYNVLCSDNKEYNKVLQNYNGTFNNEDIVNVNSVQDVHELIFQYALDPNNVSIDKIHQQIKDNEYVLEYIIACAEFAKLITP